jgi:hypothetical protein
VLGIRNNNSLLYLQKSVELSAGRFYDPNWTLRGALCEGGAPVPGAAGRLIDSAKGLGVLMTAGVHRTTFYSAFVVCVSIAMAGVTNAAIISGRMAENFDYSAGTQFPNTGGTPNGGVGWNATGDTSQANTAGWGTGNQNNGASAGTNRTATSPGLTYTATGYYPASGNKLTLDSVTPNASQSMSRNFGGQTIDSGTTYFSVLMRRENDTLRTMNLALFQLVGTTSSEKLTVGQVGANVSNVFTGSNGKIAMIYTNSNPSGIRASNVDMGTGITHLIIGRIDWNTSAALETVTMWVDPTDVTTEAAAASAQFYTGTEFDLGQINYVRPFTGNAIATPTAVPATMGSYDEFRIGGTWASVTSVPEPASMAMLAIAAFVLAAFRKKA